MHGTDVNYIDEWDEIKRQINIEWNEKYEKLNKLMSEGRMDKEVWTQVNGIL